MSMCSFEERVASAERGVFSYIDEAQDNLLIDALCLSPAMLYLPSNLTFFQC